MKLVRRKREQVHILPLALEIDGNLADCLGGVGVEESSRTTLADQSPDFRDRFQYASFVIGGHGGNQSGILSQSTAQCIQPDDALCVHGNLNDLKAGTAEVSGRLSNRGVLDSTIRMPRAKKRKELCLFDFSLAGTPPENVNAGTHPYLDHQSSPRSRHQ
jgi:hypothetical protein